MSDSSERALFKKLPFISMEQPAVPVDRPVSPIPIVVEHLVMDDTEDSETRSLLPNQYGLNKPRSNSYDVSDCSDDMQAGSSPEEGAERGGGDLPGGANSAAGGSGGSGGGIFAWLALPSLGRKRGRSLEMPKMCVHCALLQEGLLKSGVAITKADLAVAEEEPAEPPQVERSSTAGATAAAASTNWLQVPDAQSLGPSKLRSSSLDACWYRREGAHTSSTQKSDEAAVGASTPASGCVTDCPKTPPTSPKSVKPRAFSFDVAAWSRRRRCGGGGSSRGESPSPSGPRPPRSSASTATDGSSAGGKATAALLQFLKILHVSSSGPSEQAQNCSEEKQDSGHSHAVKPWSSTVDWGPTATNGEHVWYECATNSEICYVGESECQKTGGKKKCAVCKIVAHTGCSGVLDRMKFHCRSTFRAVECDKNGLTGGQQQHQQQQHQQQQHQQATVRHHWVHKRRMTGKCKTCGKSFQQKLAFNNKDVLAILCSWCKSAYHNKINCFQKRLMQESCSLGPLASITIPPSWILQQEDGTFSVEPPLPQTGDQQLHQPHPLLVLTNAKSGGNLGARVTRKLLWLLNPRQVFDLSVYGPEFPLGLFRRVPDLRVLVCGGDGTAGWVLSAIDKLGLRPWPPVAVLPLGTGNDLARTLNWGGGFAADEPLTKVLCCAEDGRVIRLDRWSIKFEPNMCYFSENCQSQNPSQQSQSEPSATDAVIEVRLTDNPELSVFNNYFSLGADAAVALEFHESREANPERFNSRLRNMMFYAGEGSRSVITRPWRDLSHAIQLDCDGIDYTERIRELKLTSILFLNIAKYSAGTTPWGTPAGGQGFEPQRPDDGLVEVIGFCSSHLATVQMGWHGHRLCQCRRAKIITYRIIPIQIDGEPWRLQPSVISICWRNQANLVMKPKRRNSSESLGSGSSSQLSSAERLSFLVTAVFPASVEDEEEKVRPLGVILVDPEATLSQARVQIELLRKELSCQDSDQCSISENWAFIMCSRRNQTVATADEPSYQLVDLAACGEVFVRNLGN